MMDIGHLNTKKTVFSFETWEPLIQRCCISFQNAAVCKQFVLCKNNFHFVV